MVDWVAVAVRFALYANLTLLFGVSAFGFYVNGAAETSTVPAQQTVNRRFLFVLAVTGSVLSLLSLVQLAAAMSGTSIFDIDGDTLRFILGETGLGASIIARFLALVVASILLWRGWIGSRQKLSGIALLAGIALGSLAWTGHGAMNEGRAGLVHLSADVLHLLAAGAWIGALLMLLRLAISAGRDSAKHVHAAHAALAGFSSAGTVLVGTIVVTGLINGWMILGPEDWRALSKSLYGQLLFAKLLLFVAMLGLASINRYRLTPSLERAIAAGNWGRAGRALRMSILIETGCAIVILVLIAWLGMLEPPTI